MRVFFSLPRAFSKRTVPCNVRSSFCPFRRDYTKMYDVYINLIRERSDWTGRNLVSPSLSISQKKKKKRFVCTNSRLKKKKKRRITSDRGRTTSRPHFRRINSGARRHVRHVGGREGGEKNGFPTKNLGVSRQADANGREGERRWDASWQSWPAKRSWKRG